jgi:hypothetical protein
VIRRPDDRTIAQRTAKAADLVRMVARLNDGPVGSTSAEIQMVRRQEERRRGKR